MSAQFRAISILVAVLFFGIVWMSIFLQEDARLKVVFLDVGQGDATFIETPNGAQILIDGGPPGALMRMLSREMSFFDRHIDMVVATHEDTDHVGGFPELFSRYRVGTYVRTEAQGKSSIADSLDVLVEGSGAHVVYARRGAQFFVDDGVSFTVLFPERSSEVLESNTSSVVLSMAYGSTTFLFTGDAPDEIEEYIVSLDPQSVRSTVLKVGHHGSRTSTSPVFLDAVSPQYVVISAGKDNRYGHPHSEVVSRLQERSIATFGTYDRGPVAFLSDGASVSVRQLGWWDRVFK